MASRGKRTALDDKPELEPGDIAYLDAFNVLGGEGVSFSDFLAYCAWVGADDCLAVVEAVSAMRAVVVRLAEKKKSG